jgi:hypothetical protein
MKHQFSLARFEEEERRRRAAVAAEFGGDTDAMAGEILRSQEALANLADATTAQCLESPQRALVRAC